MYTELLSEADSTKELEKHVEMLDEEIDKLVKRLEIKKTMSRHTKRQFDVLEHVDCGHAGFSRHRREC